MSAALVMVIAAGVLGGVDVPALISGENQAGSQAAALAQQDQERMRSMPIQQLINYSNERSVPVDSRDYTVTSTVRWVTDSGSTPACSSGDTTTGDYLRLSSTVDGPGQKRPVTIESLLTPPNGSLATTKGNLAVHVTDQEGEPVAAIPVSIPGQSANTDANGCAFFDLLDPGQYQVTISKPGYVDKAGNETVVRTETVSVGNTTVAEQSYAVAATITANVQANVYGTVQASAIRSTNGVTLSNANMLPSGTKVVGPSNGTTASVTVQRLYPFTDGYTVFSGKCSMNNPVPNGGPFSASPPPGGAATVTVRQAALNITVTVNGAQPGTQVQNAFLNLYHADSSCADFIDIPFNSNGRVTDSGFPGGTYDVCIEGRYQGQNYKIVRPGIVLNNFTNGTTLNLDAVTSSPVSGSCGTTSP